MSCEASPAFSLDLRTDWLLVGALATWTGLLLTCLWHADLPAWALLLLSVATLVWVGIAVDTQLFGLSPRAPVALSLLPDGSWQLRWREGGELPVRLLRPSRAIRAGALLVLRSQRATRWLLLRTMPTNGGELRRLRVWLGVRP